MSHTKEAGPLPNASIDFDKVQSNAKAGKEDVYAGAVAEVKLSKEGEAAARDEQRLADASADARARDAGFKDADEFAESLAVSRSGDADATAPAKDK